MTLLNNTVKTTFSGYPKAIQEKLLLIRALLLKTAAETNGVGHIDETLKWGEPSYITSETKSGSTIRLGWKASVPDEYAIYFNCKTTLVDSFKELYGDLFRYGGNRSILFHLTDQIPEQELANCLMLALTYHRNKK